MESDVLQAIAGLIPLGKIVVKVSRIFGPPVAIFAAIFFLEWLAGADRRRYYSRSFLIDVLHYAFYVGGIFAVLIQNPLSSVLASSLSHYQAKSEFLRQMPPALAYLLYFVYVDFVSYWLHRLLHANRFLWAFHSVHHSPTQLTGVTSLRRHVGEIIFNSIFTYVVIVLPLGMTPTPVGSMVAFVWGVKLLESVHHAELNWRLGFAYRIVVSPVFHAIHHSRDPAHHNKNFAIIFSVWDYIFGTAAETRTRPQAYGIEGMGISESLSGVFVTPFKNFVRAFGAHRRVVVSQV